MAAIGRRGVSLKLILVPDPRNPLMPGMPYSIAVELNILSRDSDGLDYTFLNGTERMNATIIEKDLKTRISAFENGCGLPLSLDTFHIPRITPQELTTLACLSSPLLVWRGLLCYRTHRTLKRTDLSPEWIIYAADDYGLSPDTAAAANLLLTRGALIPLPGPRPVGELEAEYGHRLRRLPSEGKRNYEVLTSLYGQLRRVSHIPIVPCAIRGGATGKGDTSHEVSLRLPVIFNLPTTAYDGFSAEYHDELLRLRHALKGVFERSQRVQNERNIFELIQELDYQISCLNEVYHSAVRRHWLSGIGVFVGLTVTAISFIAPDELRPFLLAISSPTTLVGGLTWLTGEGSPQSAVRKSDYYLAWKFQVRGNRGPDLRVLEPPMGE
jgi:hypothetical protein